MANSTKISYLQEMTFSSTIFSSLETNKTSAGTTFLLPRSNTACERFTDNVGFHVYAAFLTMVIIVSILGNLLVCVSVVLSPRLRSRATNYFLVSLAVSDILFSIFHTPYRVNSVLRGENFCFNNEVCKMFIVTDMITSPASISTLFIIALDRYICITRPFKYQTNMSRRKAVYILIITWIYSIQWGVLSTFKWGDATEESISIQNNRHCINDNKNFYITAYFVVYILPLMVMGFVYLKILKTALEQIRAIQSTEVFLQPASEEKLLSIADKRKERIKSKRTRRELKATRTVATVYGAFLLCWFPICVINIVHAFDDEVFPDLKRSHRNTFRFVYYTFGEILPILSSAINPFIYHVCSSEFRTAFRVVMLRLFRRNRELARIRLSKFELSKVSRYYGNNGKNGTNGHYSPRE